MKDPDWDRIQEIYHAAVELPPSEREAFVENACANEPDLLREVISLLNAHASLGGFPEPPFKPESDQLVGETIAGRYLVENELPPGGMGRVFRARDLQLPGRFVVIKILPQAWAKDPDAVRRFKREIEALTLVDDPNVVSVLGTGELVDATPYLVMPYVDGLSLRSQVTPNGMDPERAALILQQIGTALGHVHQKGILHRDLKPENIMLQVLSDGREVIKVLDFGIAKIKYSVVATSTINTVAIGTVPYMSPEQLRGGNRITVASDIYSMAVVAYEMITGKLPFDLPSLPQVQRPAAPVEFPRRVSKKAQRILLRALSYDPKDRYQNAKQFGDELARALLNTEPDPDPGPMPWWRRVKRIAVATAIVIFSLLPFGIYKYVNDSTTLPPNKGFNYWLTVQRMRDGNNYGTPFKSNGDDTFDSGDKFQLNVSSLKEPGYLYIFNEGAPEPNSLSFRLLYPNKVTNNGSATLGANQTRQCEWITFRGPAGAENLWIVWSVAPVSELESAKNQAVSQAGLTEENVVAIKQFLKTMQEKIKVRDASYVEPQEGKVRARSDLVLTLLQVKHR